MKTEKQFLKIAGKSVPLNLKVGTARRAVHTIENANGPILKAFGVFVPL
jgi:hypothetical protein